MLIDRRYRVVRPIGQGGAGEVYEVRDQHMKERVALKVLTAGDRLRKRGDESSNRTAVALERRFDREVRAMYESTGQHVVRVVNHGLDHSPPYYTMPLARGHLLTQGVFGTGAPLNQIRKLELFLSVLRGVQEIHNAKRVHRDIKPENVLVFPGPTIKIADLGLVSKAVSRVNSARRVSIQSSSGPITEPGILMGTPPYWAPELHERFEDSDGKGRYSVATDIYALGIVLYEFLSGKRIQLQNKLRPQDMPRGIISPITIMGIVKRAIASSPRDRFASAAEFEGALCDCLVVRDRRPLPEVLRDYLQKVIGPEWTRARRPVQDATRRRILLLSAHPGMDPKVLVGFWDILGPDVIVRSMVTHRDLAIRAARACGEALRSSQNRVEDAWIEERIQTLTRAVTNEAQRIDDLGRRERAPIDEALLVLGLSLTKVGNREVDLNLPSMLERRCEQSGGERTIRRVADEIEL